MLFQLENMFVDNRNSQWQETATHPILVAPCSTSATAASSTAVGQDGSALAFHPLCDDNDNAPAHSTTAAMATSAASSFPGRSTSLAGRGTTNAAQGTRATAGTCREGNTRVQENGVVVWRPVGGGSHCKSPEHLLHLPLAAPPPSVIRAGSSETTPAPKLEYCEPEQ